MRPLWLCWTLWLLSLAPPGAALSGEQILASLLQQLHLHQAPVLDRADLEGLAVPAHVRAQYVALLQHGHRERSRGKRFSQNFRGEAPCLAAPWPCRDRTGRVGTRASLLCGSGEALWGFG